MGKNGCSIKFNDVIVTLSSDFRSFWRIWPPWNVIFWAFLALLTDVHGVLRVICYCFVLICVRTYNWNIFCRFGSHYDTEMVEKCIKNGIFSEKRSNFRPFKKAKNLNVVCEQPFVQIDRIFLGDSFQNVQDRHDITKRPL